MMRGCIGRAMGLAMGVGLLLGVACSSDDSSADKRLHTGAPASAGMSAADVHPWVLGGQTGALTAECGVAPAGREGEPQPGGEVGFVVYTEACVAPELALPDLLAGLELLDASGALVPFELEDLTGGATLIRPLRPLAAGDYTVQGPGLEPTTVTVSEEPETAPRELGRLTQTDVNCGAQFNLRLDDAVLPYLAQLKLSAQVNDGMVRTWFEHGTLVATDGEAVLSLEQCFPQCLDDGSHELTVTAELAGQAEGLEPVTVSFDVACGSSRVSTFDSFERRTPDDSGSSCAIVDVGARTGAPPLWMTVLALGAARGWRSRRPRRGARSTRPKVLWRRRTDEAAPKS
ncbi:MAG: hypothetical protein OXU20_08410 [Myxococcales bacterium]|nr:hypothetical protein [Myxococcales bacterium]